VKICGITTPDDARLAEEVGADAIGVVLFSASPRCVSPGKAREIFDAVPSMTRVCVTHTELQADLEAICTLRPDAIQVSCRATVPVCCRSRIFRMIQAGEEIPADSDALIIDGSQGSGRLYNRRYAGDVIRSAGVPVFLAGGLTPENVTAAIIAVRPYGVDVASGVEYAPGRKDPEKVRLFVEHAKGVI
jgi:phosphoribosylanthranilate isomerase